MGSAQQQQQLLQQQCMSVRPLLPLRTIPSTLRPHHPALHRILCREEGPRGRDQVNGYTSALFVAAACWEVRCVRGAGCACVLRGDWDPVTRIP